MSGALTANDLRLMDVALAHAFAGLGTDRADPSVGWRDCPRTAASLATGATAPGGRPHAETQALDKGRVRPRAAARDVYVTLEPCSHQGEDPRLAPPRLSGRVVARVVVGLIPILMCAFSGRGIAMLARSRDRGDRRCARQKEGEAINAGFFSRVRTGLPLVLQDRRPQYLRCRSGAGAGVRVSMPPFSALGGRVKRGCGWRSRRYC